MILLRTTYKAKLFKQAVDLIGPVLGVIDSFVGVREKTTALYTYGFLLMRQQNLQEARSRLNISSLVALSDSSFNELH